MKSFTNFNLAFHRLVDEFIIRRKEMNKIRLILGVSIATTSVLITGCGDTNISKKEAPLCSDTKIIDTLKKTYYERVQKIKKNPGRGITTRIFVMAVPEKMIDITSARSVEYKENINLRSCKAKVFMGKDITLPVEYTVQADEKNSEQIYVDLNMNFLQGTVQPSILKRLK